MPAINSAYLEARLSGGAGNTDPDASLGGDLSSTRPDSQSASGITNVTGVTIDFAAGNPVGAGTLSYVVGEYDSTLQWQPNGLLAGTAVVVTEDARYALYGEEGVLFVTVDFSSLPVIDKSDAITIANIANEVWDDVAKAESFAGDVEYRCLYLVNAHGVDPFLMVSVYIAEQPIPGEISVGADPAGVGDGITRSVSSITRSGSVATATTAASHGYASGQTVRILGAAQAEYNGLHEITVTGASTFTYAVSGAPATPATGTLTCGRGVPLTVANENTAPVGVTFSTPLTEAAAIELGELAEGECVAYWERRTIPSRNTTSDAETVSRIGYPAYF